MTPDAPPGIQELERKMVVGREKAEGLTTCRDMVSALPAGSIDKAMEQLTAKFGDSFRLAASFIPATGGKAGTTKKQKF